MVRILQCVNNMHRAGIETMLMNYYRNIDRTQLQFDFLTHRPFRSDFDDEIESMGGKIYYAPRLVPQNYPAYFAYMKRFFAEHPEYQIVHSHIDAMSYLPLLAAKKANVPVRIAHSHNTAIDLDYKYLLKQFFRKNICKVATNYLACGQEAGQFLFGKDNIQVIPNAIIADQFLFDETVRRDMREKLGLSDKFIIGHVGRFAYAKNHGFLIDIFNQLQNQIPHAVLLLIGTGENEAKIKEKVRKLGLADKVQFLGVRSDVAQLYQAMDVFLLPSLFEGVPVVGIEAQFADLPCVFSNKVPREVAFSEKCQFIDLQDPPEAWAAQIAQWESFPRNRIEAADSSYRIENAAGNLMDYYFSYLTD